MLILVTGPTGKVGQHFIADLLDAPRFAEARIRALCHSQQRPLQLDGQQQGEGPAGLAATGLAPAIRPRNAH
ncbi:uncharacterized protein YbjT (DUF2867 family) [Rhizobium azooxidifex]|uniref:Uncharacterized protein YbjT (DUF2867 family) n=1 Tax=Mycoplana azooxidifex TaxID=1636188 RepID=A0A7W6GIV4_9HYPH|nr:uncharacterized protein YbjT (DUF2867 family) [Mycoplana azooxidifex]